MIWLRKGLVHLLSLFLLVALIGGALATSAELSLTHPAKLENWLSQSNLYDHFVSNAIDQSQKSTGNQSGSVSLGDTVVKQAAESAFSTQLLQKDVNTFLDSNYAWLQGKTSTPNFTIDLSGAKQNFANAVGQYVTTYSANLPVCSSAQLAKDQNIDPLAAVCLPQGVNAQAAGAQVTQQLTSSSGFLSNPVITASSINPNQNSHSQPYYQRVSQLPKIYRLATKLPLALGGLAVLITLAIVFIAPRKRKGVRRVAAVLVVSGIVLVVIKFAADYAVKKVEHQVFNNANIGQLQQSLTNFAQRVESSLVKTDMIFGIAFIAAALIIFGILIKTRQPGGSKNSVTLPSSGALAEPGQTDRQSSPLGPLSRISWKANRPQPTMDVAPPVTTPRPSSSPTPPMAAKKPIRRKPPRLIQ
jgi:hypothetical protein